MRPVLGTAMVLAAVVSGCSDRQAPGAGSTTLLGLGRDADSTAIVAWDIDVNPAGAGLPPGRGTHDQGAVIFQAKCAACHGAHGEGMHPAYPALVGTEPRDFSFDDDPKKVKTIGNYWPYATTLFDYLRRTMPQTAPGSLQPDELYALCAFLLAENNVIPRDAVMNATTLPRVQMPARDRFVLDDRRDGPTFR